MGHTRQTSRSPAAALPHSAPHSGTRYAPAKDSVHFARQHISSGLAWDISAGLLAASQSCDGGPHVHGANLGVPASAYFAVGGFDPVPANEDVRLVEKLRTSGAPILATARIHAVTSGRLRGRVDAGFAGYLRGLERGPEPGTFEHAGTIPL